jgi:quercetin dioxygenase-like cupin family protein
VTVVSFSGLELRFKQDKHATHGRLDLFEMIVQPKAKMPVAHYHENWDETIYGLVGVTTWRVAGVDHLIGPGDTVFIAKGVVHGFRNDSQTPASCLCILTPGALGPDYFQEMAALAASGAPDAEKMKAVMRRYGLIAAPNS